jgi:hypothetical protein
MNEKKNCLCFFFFSFFLRYGQISCVSNAVLVGSVIWDDTEYLSHFPKTINVYCLRKVRQHKSGIFGYSKSETILSIGWYTCFLASVAPLLQVFHSNKKHLRLQSLTSYLGLLWIWLIITGFITQVTTLELKALELNYRNIFKGKKTALNNSNSSCPSLILKKWYKCKSWECSSLWGQSDKQWGSGAVLETIFEGFIS